MRDKIDFTTDYGTKCESGDAVIKVLGVGGGGGNAVQYMYSGGIIGVDFAVCNTDKMALDRNRVPQKLVLGDSGLGAGANPDVARKMAEDSHDRLVEFIGKDTKMLFITAGMGKGTGTGAAPVVAKIAHEMGILTVGVVTSPFDFEGLPTRENAEKGIEEMRANVDSLLIIKNQNLIKYNSSMKMSAAYKCADEVLNNAVKAIAELITVHAIQNVDFNDVQTIMKNSGDAMLGLATAEGENKIDEVVDKALTCPLLNEEMIKEAKNFLFFFTYSSESEPTMEEFDRLTQKFESLKSRDARVIWGQNIDEELGSSVKLAVVITNYTTEEKEKIKDTKVSDYTQTDKNTQPQANTADNTSTASPMTSNPENIFDSTSNGNWTPNQNPTPITPNDPFSGFNMGRQNGGNTGNPTDMHRPNANGTPDFFPQKIEHPNNYDDDARFMEDWNTPALFAQQRKNAQTATMQQPVNHFSFTDAPDSDSIFRNIPD